MTTETTETTVDPLAERFKRDTADHALTVLHDDGLYRHLRFAQPEPHSWLSRFELATWPGTLAIHGDCGTFMFSRSTDMFEFFRMGSRYGINPGYWSEKLPGGRGSAREYSEDKFKALIAERLAEYENDEYQDLVTAHERGRGVAPMLPEDARDLVEDYDRDDRLGFESGARELLGALEQHRIVSDTWEWDLSDWDWQFLWCCHAIAWGIAQYDAARASDAPQAAAS